MKDRALVRNAADPKQVGTAGKREKDDRELELADLAAVLELPEGRRLLWRLLSHCKVFESVFDESGERMAFNAGRQDVGHFVMAEITTADPTKILLMMQESAARERLRNNTTDALHTASVTEETADAQEP